MTCFCPIDGWRSFEPNDNGRYPVVFSPRGAALDERLQLPCGRCVGCRGDQARYWALRMHHEASLHDRSCFLTLTYQDAPPELSKPDLQRFIKRLRHKCRFRYFACGEYGSQSHRAHYHLAVFGADFLGGSIDIDGTLYTHPLLVEKWGLGFVSVGSLTMESCMYVAGYALKKLGDGESWTLMSRRPPIGRGWVAKYADDIRRTGCVVVAGREYAVPPVYLDWENAELQSVVDSRRDLFRCMSSDDRHRRNCSLRSRQLNALARISMKGERI